MPVSPDPADAVTQYEYTTADGYIDEQEQSQCPHCEMIFADGSDDETVIDQDGTTYKTIDETAPVDGPFFCPPCWTALETARLARQSSDGSEEV